VPSVDLARYAGTWYELARFPNRFERGLVAVTATYTLRDDGTVGVRNAGRQQTVDGPEQSVDGYAWVPDPTDTAKLRVRFFWPFHGAYWVIALADDYRWAVVGSPGRDYLWLLSRTPQLPPEDWATMEAAAAAQGFDTTLLERIAQP
jgi:apolipoprotein D and lipocalin family protein